MKRVVLAALAASTFLGPAARAEVKTKEIEYKQNRLAGVLELGLHGIDLTTARLLLVAVADSSWALDRVLNLKGDEDAWPAIEKLPLEKVVKHIAAVVADNLVDDRDSQESGVNKVVNQLAAAPAAKKGKGAK